MAAISSSLKNKMIMFFLIMVVLLITLVQAQRLMSPGCCPPDWQSYKCCVDFPVCCHDEEVNDSPIEQVRLTIPITDDPTLPALTFRTWVLGPITCLTLSILGQYSSYRQFYTGFDPSCVQLLLLLTGKLMAATLPTKPIAAIPGTKWTFSMNPGPFNVKELTLLVILANCGFNSAFSLGVISVTKGLFHKNFGFWESFSLVQSSQMIGYGFAGIFIKNLVDSPYMWWPFLLPSVTMYRMMHDVEQRPKGRISKIQFYIIVAISSFAYNIIPGYFFPSLIALSFVCWIWKDSVTAQQIGSGLHGLGIGSFTFNWLSMSSYAGDPLVMPFFVIVNMFAGFILITYIVAPIGYWTNSHNAKRFPFMSNDVFDVNGQTYNVSQILKDDLSLDEQRYNKYPMYWSGFYIYSIGFMLASEAAVITYFLLNHARELCRQLKPRSNGGNNELSDVHNRLMKKYEVVPKWWFYTIIVSSITLAILNCKFNGKQFQLSYWMVVLGYFLPFVLILPAGAIQATTGQEAFNIFTLSEVFMGLIYPDKPIANMVFRSYATSTLNTTLAFLADFKLGHYMKIPPKSMFVAQVTGSFISSFANLVIQWWVFSTVEHICDIEKLPKGSPWTCPTEHSDYSKSMVWGVLGPKRVFSSHNTEFSNIYIFVIIGVISAVVTWKLARIFPEKNWIGLVHIPLIYSSATMLPPAGAINYWSSFIVAVIFHLIIYRKYKEWWARYNYLLSGALSVGITFSQLATNWSLNVYGLQWWGLEYGDHCPLAKC